MVTNKKYNIDIFLGVGGGPSNGPSYRPSISADGSFICFQSAASNLVASDTNGFSDIFLYERATQTVERVSVSETGVEGLENSSSPKISSDGRFIAFEGGEGMGKSTQARLLAEFLRGEGRSVELTREPGGTPGAEAIRELLLSPPGEGWTLEAEALLFAAARADHVARKIRPAIEAGDWATACRATLDYYDRCYDHELARSPKRRSVDLTGLSVEKAAEHLIAAGLLV